MNVTEIAGRARIEPRVIRYVLDHGVVSGVEKDTEKRGAPRVLDHEEALAVSIAALLLKAGLKRKFVQGFVRGVLQRTTGGPSAAAKWLVRGGPVGDTATIEALEIADRAFVRITHVGGSHGPVWHDLRSGMVVAKGYMPLVTVRINLVELRRRLHES